MSFGTANELTRNIQAYRSCNDAEPNEEIFFRGQVFAIIDPSESFMGSAGVHEICRNFAKRVVLTMSDWRRHVEKGALTA